MLGSPVARIPGFHCRGTDLISGLGTETQSEKKKKERNEVFMFSTSKSMVDCLNLVYIERIQLHGKIKFGREIWWNISV